MTPVPSHPRGVGWVNCLLDVAGAQKNLWTPKHTVPLDDTRLRWTMCTRAHTHAMKSLQDTRLRLQLSNVESCVKCSSPIPVGGPGAPGKPASKMPALISLCRARRRDTAAIGMPGECPDWGEQDMR